MVTAVRTTEIHTSHPLPHPGEVQVQIVSLDQPREVVSELARTLAPDEQERALRFVFPRDQSRFIVGRGVLRSILGEALGTAPVALRFAYGAHGKPELAAPFNRSGLTFNLAHSSDVALVAVARGAPIGVDIERLRPVDDLDGIIKQTFSDRERRTLLALPASDRARGFFHCWTRKEAFVKAIGDGLSYPLESFSMSLRDGDQPRLEHIGGDEDAGLAWSVLNLEPAPEYVAAVVIAGRCTRCRRRHWTWHSPLQSR
jgi:4'-phosphopantetheinyl transferase